MKGCRKGHYNVLYIVELWSCKYVKCYRTEYRLLQMLCVCHNHLITATEPNSKEGTLPRDIVTVTWLKQKFEKEETLREKGTVLK